MLAMGDALAVALIKQRNFQAHDFRRIHPGGHLGEQLQVKLSEVMLTGSEVPVVMQGTGVEETLTEMDRKGLGATLILGPDRRLEGIFTDGDLRRAVRRLGNLQGKVIDQLMTARPAHMSPGQLVADALELMEQRLITVLPVVDDNGRLQGILHLHDLLGKGKVSFRAQDPSPKTQVPRLKPPDPEPKV
jgi:arabinose-5-phosphate isomerase